MSLALLLALSFGEAAAKDQRPKITTVKVGGWDYVVYDDRFTQQKACRLHMRGVSYAHGALTFHMGGKVDTFDAVYKVDDGPAQPALAHNADLATQGVVFSTDTLANPSGGLVSILAKDSTEAKSVSIRSDGRAKPRVFKIEGFTVALAAAEAVGCPSDRFY